jgi:hypothetical protein
MVASAFARKYSGSRVRERSRRIFGRALDGAA